MNSIYIHIPFCKRKCFYCDFYSLEDNAPVDQFIKSLKTEIDIYHEKNYFSEVQTIYFGGGTPSIIEHRYIHEILEHLNKYYSINSNAEISIEANPGSITKETLIKYKEYGINRISIGIQSFIQKELDFLERIHSVKEAKEAILTAKDSGFDNVSLDLIYAIPFASLDDWKYNLDTALSFEPKHISAYSLIFEEGTRLYNDMLEKKIRPIEEEIEAQMYEYAIRFLDSNKYNHYEVSNYALSGFECQHNKNYWNFSNYIGLGPSAHSFVNRSRHWNFRDLRNYISSLNQNIPPVESMEYINNEMLLEEIVFLGLRSNGIDLDKIKKEFDVDFYEKNRNIIDDLLNSGYIKSENRKILLTEKGFLICDEICKKLI
jgi:oxygen-independent coproporphyrinogen III oxidase